MVRFVYFSECSFWFFCVHLFFTFDITASFFIRNTRPTSLFLEQNICNLLYVFLSNFGHELVSQEWTKNRLARVTCLLLLYQHVFDDDLAKIIDDDIISFISVIYDDFANTAGDAFHRGVGKDEDGCAGALWWWTCKANMIHVTNVNAPVYIFEADK